MTTSRRRLTISGGLKPQQHFPIDFIDSGLYSDHPHIGLTLQEACAIARRIAMSQRGRDATNIALQEHEAPPVLESNLPDPVSANERTVDLSLMERQSAWYRSQGMTILLESQLEAYGMVRDEGPDKMVINLELATVCANTRRDAGPDSEDYRNHVFFLSVVIMHEMQHLMRRNIPGVPRTTPPKISSSLHVGAESKGPEGTYTTGESGWWWEHAVFGGYVTRCGASPTYGEKILYGAYIEDLVLQQNSSKHPSGLQYFIISPKQIEDIVKGTNEWASHLPLKDSDRYRTIQGSHPTQILRSSQRRHPSETPSPRTPALEMDGFTTPTKSPSLSAEAFHLEQKRQRSRGCRVITQGSDRERGSNSARET